MCPTLPRKPCARGCGKLVEAHQRSCWECTQHAKSVKQHRPPGWKPRPRKRDTRLSASKRGYGARWQRYCKSFLSKYSDCNHCAKKSSMVDHIEPIYGPSDSRFWSQYNHQALCRACHAIKTGRDRRQGKTRRNRR